MQPQCCPSFSATVETTVTEAFIVTPASTTRILLNDSRDNHNLADKDLHSSRVKETQTHPNSPTSVSESQAIAASAWDRQGRIFVFLDWASHSSMCITCVKRGGYRWDAPVAALPYSAAALLVHHSNTCPRQGLNHSLPGTLCTGAHS